jgi:hypothetical protein
MIQIRSEQLALFETEAFERVMVEHLRDTHAVRFAALPASDLLRFVRQTFTSARACGVRGRENLCTFLELAVAFGPEFPEECEWASQVLKSSSELSPERRIQALLDSATRYLDAQEQLRALELERAEAAKHAPPDPGDGVEDPE